MSLPSPPRPLSPAARFIQRAFFLFAILLLSGCKRTGLREQVTRLPAALEVKQLGRASALAIARSPGYSIVGGVSMLYQRGRAAVRGTFRLPILELTPDQIPPPGTPAFERLLDSRKMPPLTPAALTLLVDGKEFFPDFIRTVQGAVESIDVQSYIFDNDDVGVTVANLLRKKAETIRVRVLFDTLGTVTAHHAAPEAPAPGNFTPPDFMGDYLQKGSKVRVRRTTNPWLISDHTKLQIIDKRVAYLGGMNFGREYWDEWHDLMVRVEGPVVSQLRDVFQLHWRTESAWQNWTFQTLPSYLKERSQWDEQAAAEGPPGRARILRTDLALGRFDIAKAMQLAIRGARKRAWIETPYLTDDDIAEELRQAALRGVDVRVVLPSKSDSFLMKVNNYTTARALKDAGAKVLIYPGMTHLKVLLCDDWMTFGSANADTLSLRINRELNLATSTREDVESMASRIFLTDFKKSRPVTDLEIQKNSSILIESISDQL